LELFQQIKIGLPCVYITPRMDEVVTYVVFSPVNLACIAQRIFFYLIFLS